ncbi:MAG: RNA methyltransferase [Burkholderiaceae bacterium]
MRIESAANPRFRALLALAGSARERRQQGLSVIEGAHLCDSYLERHGAPLQLFVPDDPTPEVAALAARARTLALSPVTLTRRLFAQASQVGHGPGPLAIIATPQPELPGSLSDDAVYLDRVQDPGNVGSVLRTCAAVGVGRVITAPGTAACWSPKVLRAAMGAHFHLVIHEDVDAETLLARLAIEAVATVSGASTGLYQADLRAPRIWLFGNEGQGLAPLLQHAPGLRRLAIPQTDAVESLNVGVAAAVCLFEQLRQRAAGP